MKIDFTVKQNFKPGMRAFKKHEDEIAKERITFKMTKRQKLILFSFCEENNISVSDVVRTSLADYFEKVGYVIPPDPVEDKRQLKMFDQPKEPDQPE